MCSRSKSRTHLPWEGQVLHLALVNLVVHGNPQGWAVCLHNLSRVSHRVTTVVGCTVAEVIQHPRHRVLASCWIPSHAISKLPGNPVPDPHISLSRAPGVQTHDRNISDGVNLKSCHCQKRWSITLTRASDVKGYIHDAHRVRYRCSAMRCKGLAGGGQSCLRLLPGSVISVNLVLDSQTLDAA